MNNIDRDELRKYVVKRGTIEECKEVIRLLKDLGERVYPNVSWRHSYPRNFLYYDGKVWIGSGYATGEGHKIDTHTFIELLKGNQTSSETTNLKQGKTTAELVLTYFKQKQKTKDMQ